jgi:hypothetical protein
MQHTAELVMIDEEAIRDNELGDKYWILIFFSFKI